MKGVNNVIIASLNFLSLLWSIFLVILSSYIILHGHTECLAESPGWALVYGIFLFTLSLVAIIGAMRKQRVLLSIYMWALVIWIIVLICTSTFYLVVSKEIAAKTSIDLKEYQLKEYPHWLRMYVDDGKRWDTVKGCMVEDHLCQKLYDYTSPAAKESLSTLSPIQYGCCRPPPYCGFLNKTDTVWEVPKSGVASKDQDCTSWGNQYDKMCYDCNSCKAGHIQALKFEVAGQAIGNILQIIFLTIILAIVYFALRKAQRQNDYSPYNTNP